VDKDEIVSMASFALGNVIYGGGSVETAVRAVLRIAALQHHTWWQLWAYTQLNENGDDQTTSAMARESLARAFPLEMDGEKLLEAVEQQHNDIIESAVEDVTETRILGEERDRVLTHSVAEIEYLARENKDQSSRFVLTRIKNRALAYLMSVESKQSPPTPYVEPESD
jgi:hypothetical protein